MSQNSIVEIAKDKMFMKNTISIADFQKVCHIRASQLSCTDYLNNSLLNAFFSYTSDCASTLFSCLTDSNKNINNMKTYHVVS